MASPHFSARGILSVLLAPNQPCPGHLPCSTRPSPAVGFQESVLSLSHRQPVLSPKGQAKDFGNLNHFPYNLQAISPNHLK